MAEHPPGTRFLLEAGVHRGQALVPRDGDVIAGEPGAVLSGAVPLDPAAFREVDGQHVLSGRAEEPEVRGSVDEGFERDAANHDLWAGGTRLRHVAAREDADTAGEWFFDYDADEVVLGGPPPAEEALELATTRTAIASDADDVVLRDLVVERYASAAQEGAVHVRGRGWRLAGLEVRDNHGVGIHLGERSQLRGATVTGNGQLGIGATQAHGFLVADTEVSGNGGLGYQWAWEAGGLKVTYTDGGTVTGSRVVGNRGVGIWFDLDDTDSTITDNLVEGNEVVGIFVEVSQGAVVRGNTVRGNGLGERAGPLGAGVFVSGSTGVSVEGNVVAGNALEVVAVHDGRRDEAGRPYEVDDLEVTGNEVTASAEGAVGFYVDTDEVERYTDGSATFEGNTYRLDGCERCFRWGELVDVAGWQAAGNDEDGVFTEVDR